MSEELPCKICGEEHYVCHLVDQRGQFKLFVATCPRCGEPLIPVRVDSFCDLADLSAACLAAWNMENAEVIHNVGTPGHIGWYGVDWSADVVQDARRLQTLMNASGREYEEGFGYQMVGRLREYIDSIADEVAADTQDPTPEGGGT